MLHNLFMVPFLWFRLTPRRDTISRSGETVLVKQNLRRLVQMRSARPITAEVVVSVGSVPTTGLHGIFGGMNLKVSLKQTAGRWFSRSDFSGLDADTQARIEEAADNIGYAPATDFQSSMAFSGTPDGEIDCEAERRAREFLEQKHGIRLRLTQEQFEPLMNNDDDDAERVFFVCKEGRAIDPDQERSEPSHVEPSFEEFGMQVSELVDQEPQPLITHSIESFNQESLLPESLLIVQAAELGQEATLADAADMTSDTVDCTRDFLESCAELDPLVPPSEKILTVVPGEAKNKEGTKAQSKSGAPRQSRKQKKKTTAAKSKKLQPILV
jgi:hypothetical protein